jgi:hypothetical protein
MAWAEEAYNQSPPPESGPPLQQPDPSRRRRWIRLLCATLTLTVCAVLVAVIAPGAATAPSPPNVGHRVAPTATLRHHDSGERTRTVGPLTTLFPLQGQTEPISTPLLVQQGNYRR